MADKRRKCTISDDGMHVTPCEMLESQAEFGHPRGKKRGIFCWQYTSSETGLKTRTFFGVVSTESPNGMIFNCCPFCGERIDHPCLEPDERAELLAKSAISHAAGQEAVAWFVQLDAPGYRDHGTKLGPFSKESEADAWTERREDGIEWKKVPLYLTPAQPPASAEVGQDGEQCRAASVEDSAVNAVLTTIRRERDAWLSWNHDHPEQAAITTPDVLEMAANLIRALSRGVPEGETVPKILMRAVKAANSAGAESLADDILSLMDTHWPTSDAAIAAQRKEGE